MRIFDIVVIGGGPAGMMAAIWAARRGASTALVEKNAVLGKKLMLTGRGRCNYSHHQEDPLELAQAFGDGASFLVPALQAFGVAQTVQFFQRWGVEPAYERGHRIYPAQGQDASALLDGLWAALKDARVTVLRETEVRGMDFLGGKARRLLTRQGEIEARAFIVATGGLSFPDTGSTGDGYIWARRASMAVVEPQPALCPIKIQERFGPDLAGLKLKNVRLRLICQGQEVAQRFGEMDFTPFGVSGAIAMDLAAQVGACLRDGTSPELHIDLKPALDPHRLDARIDRDFQEFAGEPLGRALRKMLPRQIIAEVVKMARLELNKPCQDLSQEERLALRQVMKDFAVTPRELLGFRHSIITAGGVDLQELDPATMASKRVANLYWAGEVLDLQAPTGGYNLQQCWSTGFLAGNSAAQALGFEAPIEDQENQDRQEPAQPQGAPRAPRGGQGRPREALVLERDGQDFAGWKRPQRLSQDQEGGPRPAGRPSEDRLERCDGFRPQRAYRPRPGGRPSDDRQELRDEFRPQRAYQPQPNGRSSEDRQGRHGGFRPQRAYRPRSDGRPSDDRQELRDEFRPQRAYQPQPNGRSSEDRQGRPGGFRPQRLYRPRTEGRSNEDQSERRDGFRPQRVYRPRSDGRPSDDHQERRDGFRPQRVYRPRSDGRPSDDRQERRDGFRPQRAYRPRTDRRPSEDRQERPSGFRPQRAYRPRPDGRPSEDRQEHRGEFRPKRPYRPHPDGKPRSDRPEGSRTDGSHRPRRPGKGRQDRH